MKILNKITFKGDSGNIYSVVKELGSGGQGFVYLVKDKSGNQYALKWYKDLNNQKSQKEILKNVLNNEPIVKSNDIKFIWPYELVSSSQSKSFGYIMPLYDNKKFINYNQIINRKAQKPSLKQLCYISYLIVEALEAVHRKGMAYCDINLGNIQFNCSEEQIIVCDNDNVIINNSDVNILGVPEFMAPEVALGENKPNNLSDLYSLAILLYMLWMYEHPMEGKKTNNVRCFDLIAKTNHYHKNPIFVHNPNDLSNSLEGIDIYKFSLALWNYYPTTRCKKAFIKTFTNGIRDPNRRTKTSEWKTIFLEMYSNTLECPYCKTENIYDVDKPRICIKCKNKLSNYLILDIKNRASHIRLVVNKNLKIYPYHLGDMTNIKLQQPIGQIEPHPEKQGAFIIRNLSNVIWQYNIENQNYSINPNKARALVPSGELFIEDIPIEVKIRN